jgi:hypothetical protein
MSAHESCLNKGPLTVSTQNAIILLRELTEIWYIIYSLITYIVLFNRPDKVCEHSASMNMLVRCVQQNISSDIAVHGLRAFAVLLQQKVCVINK